MSLVATKQTASAFLTFTQILDAAGEGVGVAFRAEISDSINRVHFYCLSVNGTPPAYAVRVETLDANGLPSGTLVGGSAEETFTPTADTWFTVTLSSPAALTAGTHYAVIITDEATGTPPDGTDNATFLYRSAGVQGGLMPIAVLNTGAWAKSTVLGSMPAIMPQFDGTTDRMLQGVMAADTNPLTTFNSGSTPDEYGILFTVPTTMDLFGLHMPLRLNAGSSDFNISLYGGDGTGDDDLVVRLGSYDASFMNTGSHGFTAEFPTPQTLSPGINYRLTITPTTVNDVRVRQSSFGSSALRVAAFGADHQKTTRVNAGAWTDDPTSIVYIQPYFENLVAGGGGLLVHPGTSGGARG